MAEYFGLRLDKLSYIDSTEIGGSSPVAHVGHAAAAIAAGKCPGRPDNPGRLATLVVGAQCRAG